MGDTAAPGTSTPRREFGIQIIQTWTWPETRDRMRWFESLGFESLWLTDHLTRTANPGEPYLEAWTLLSALATEVEQARLGVLVSSNTFRHPGVLAKMAVTVDHISNGRLELGVGAGWFRTEHDMFGLDFPDTAELVDRYAEALDLLDRFLSNDVTTFAGEYYHLREAPNRPPPIQQPRMPIMIGAHGPRMINLAARYADTWNTRGTPEEVRERNQRMDAACAKIGRDPKSVKRSLLYVIAQMPDEHPWDSLDAFTDFVGRFTEAGVEQFIVQPPEPEHFAIVERVATEVIPTLLGEDLTVPTPITFGIQTMLAEPWPEIRRTWEAYDAAGWDSLWLPDHLIPPSGEPGPFHEAWTALAALANVTSRARVGILVSSNTFRHPGVLAKMAVTVDHISGGRSALGIGAGWFVAEHEAFGIEFPETGERVSRYGEALALLDQFLRNDTTTFAGTYYRLNEAPNRPPPVQARLPIMVGAHGARTIRLAARHADIWNSRGTVDEMRERSDALSAAAEKAGRDPGEIVRSAYYNPTRTDFRPWESADAFATWVDRYRHIGFTDFLFEEPPPEHREVADRIARELLPELRRG